MTNPTRLAHRRMINQHIALASAQTPAEVVRWMGMLQAQDYLGALWAVGLRMQSATQAAIEQALAAGSLLRTWPARGTLHFVAAEDVRWMLALLGPRAIARSARRYQQLELDQEVLSRCQKLAAQALGGGNQLTREALYQVFEAGHISTAGQRGIHIVGRLAQEALICFGPRQGKQHTFVLLDEWAPPGKMLTRDQAAVEIAVRYFTSHGPATLRDFTWWTGLSASEASAALDAAEGLLMRETLDGKTCWHSPALPPPANLPPAGVLLPGFDEYLVGYTDRGAVLDPLYVRQINAGGGMLNPVIVLDGQVVGTWKRALKKTEVVIAPHWFVPLAPDQVELVQAAAQRYAAFLNLQAVIV